MTRSDPTKWERLTEGERRHQAMRDAAPELYEYVASSASNGCATAQALIAKVSA